MVESSESLEVKLKLLTGARENCAKHYDDYYRTFTALDGKAQATATFAGAQLGLLLALLQKADLQVMLDTFGVGILVLAVFTLVLLVGVVAASILTMKVRKVPIPFMADREVEALKDLVALPPWEANQEMVVNHLSEHLEAWRSVLTGMEKVVGEKANSVFACQWGMVAGLVGTTITLFVALLAITG